MFDQAAAGVALAIGALGLILVLLPVRIKESMFRRAEKKRRDNSDNRVTSASATVFDEVEALRAQVEQLTKAAVPTVAPSTQLPHYARRWGEETLRNVLESSELFPYVDFLEQPSSSNSRPDVVIRIPEGGELVIDAKLPLADYLAASEESSPSQRELLLSAHARNVRQHVLALSRKEYWNRLSDQVAFVVLYIPGDNFFAAALDYDRDLFDFAARNSVMLASPSTLSALLKSLAYTWRKEFNRQRSSETEVGIRPAKDRSEGDDRVQSVGNADHKKNKP